MRDDVTARADVVARALVQRDTDPNEFAKVATYVRTHHDGAQFFRLLDTMVQAGQYLVRSGRTLDYYRNIQEVCRQHLGTYRQAQCDQAQELAEILGWTTRLMRFYKEQGVPPAERQAAARAGGASSPQAVSRREEPVRNVKPAPTPKSPAASPTREASIREVVTLVEDAKKRRAQVETKAGEHFVCTDLPAYPTPKKGTRCRADVTRRDGKIVRAVFKGLES